MTPERWQKVKEIFDAALRIEPAQRSPFLSRACGSDDDLRQEVESLIASHEKTGTFIDSPAYQAAAEMIVHEKSEFKTGDAIGSYEIMSFISRGGMGEVYLAQDRRLSRKVALKILPASFTRNVERLRRFEQEARAASALNHPNIITIYEILKTDSTHVISTEFVEGETLRQHLSHTALTINQSLQIAIQVADALTAAHQAGIVHRDVKPENIMLRPDGYVKVLDFGLAKLAERTNSVTPDEALTKQVRTGSGVIIGTAGYMSPEQARGKQIDARSDIFSLGAVLYEMVARRKPFEGETASDMLAAILKTEPPPLTEIFPETPPELVRILTKALRKDPEQRYQVVKDLLLDLKSLKEELDFQAKLGRSLSPGQTSEASTVIESQNLPASGIPSSSEIRTAISTITHSLSAEIRRHRAGVTLATIVLLMLIGAGIVALYRVWPNRARINNDTSQVLTTTQLTFSPGLDNFPSLAPDGKSVVYSSDQNGSFEIYIRQLTPGGGELQLTNDGKQNLQPSWSPDGQRIAYSSRVRGGIWLVSALGGAPRQLTEFGSSPSWSRDGLMIAFQSGVGAEVYHARAMTPSTIWIVSSQGGTPTQVTKPGNPAGGHHAATWSPDGKRLAFEVSDFISSSCWLVIISTGEVKRITEGDNPILGPDGRHIFFIGERFGGGLMKVELSPSGDPVGEPATVMAASPGVNIRNLTTSADGKKLVYSAARTLSNLWSVSLSPASDPLGPPAVFSRDTSLRNNLPRFSPDGQKLALNRWRPGTSADVWIADANGSNLVQLTSDPATDTQANWFPEGDKLAFLSDRDHHHMMFWTISLTSGKEGPFLDLGEGVEFAEMSPDAKHIAFNLIQNGAMNVWIADVKEGQRRQLTFDDQFMGFPCWSPDGKWLAFEEQRGEDAYLMVVPADGGQPAQLTYGSGKSWPHSWSPDGDKIAFAGQRDGVWNIYWISRSTGVQKQLTHYSKLNAFARYPAWSPKGNQIVYEYAETTGNIWVAELK